MSLDKIPERIYDVLLFGATGFTGRLVAEYLADKTRQGGDNEGLRWAIAGRNKDKLEALQKTLQQRNPACESVDVLTADLLDWSTLVALTQRTKVLITTVGPYIDNGDKVVHACIAGKADYVDITGEPEFVDLIIERYGAKARDAGVRIVNCCGFDSIPHDLGVFYTVEQLPEGEPIEVEGFVRFNGQPSGGTWRSAITAMGRLRDVRKKKAAAHASKSAASRSSRRVYSIKTRPGYNRQLRGWAAPMPTIDGSIVRRSARAIERYGPSFGYSHNGIWSSFSQVAKLGIGVGAVFALAQFGPTRNYLLERKQSGDGPSPEVRKKSWFDVRFLAKAGGTSLVTRVSGGDPGYEETAKMAAESALCLAFDGDRLPESSGIVTPAQAMGQPLLERLQKAGIGFEIVKRNP